MVSGSLADLVVQASAMNVSLDFVNSLKKEKQLLIKGTAALNASEAFPA